MNCVGGKGGNAHRPVIGRLVKGIGIAHSHTRWHVEALSSLEDDAAVRKINLFAAAYHERVLTKLRDLGRFRPTRRRNHVGDAGRAVAGGSPPEVLVDRLAVVGWDTKRRCLMDAAGTHGSQFGTASALVPARRVVYCLAMGRDSLRSGELLVRSGAQPIELHGDAGLPAVLLIHGFTGFVRDMRPLAEALHGVGHSVSAPRLPGHGTNGRDFRTTGWSDWLRRAIDAYAELGSRNPRVVVGGLSMGGLLATILAARFPVHGLMLYAPAFRTINPLVSVSPLLRWVVPPLKVRAPESYPDDAERQYMADEYWNWQWPAQTASLYRLMRHARRALPLIDVPVLTVVSKKDESVPESVAGLVQQRAPDAYHTRLTLEHSGHVVTDGSERDTVIAATLNWMKERV